MIIIFDTKHVPIAEDKLCHYKQNETVVEIIDNVETLVNNDKIVKWTENDD